MRKPYWFATLFTLAVIGMAALGPTHAEAPSKPIRIGLLATMFRSGKPTLFAAFKKPFSALVLSQTGLQSELVMATNVDELGQWLAEGKLNFGLCHGFEFAWIKQQQPNLEPLMIAAPVHKPLKGYLVVSAVNAAKTLQDLKGKSVALPNGIHETARLYAARECDVPREGSSRVFDEITKPVNSETALHDVYEDKVQAAVVDSAGLQCFAERYPARSKRIRKLAESQAFPMTVIVAREGALEPDILRRFREGMARAGQVPDGRQLMALMHSTGFEPLPADYERQLDTIAKSYPSPSDER
jgi:ABC-type phosphate/phosphonate transport system substrate-binding protein